MSFSRILGIIAIITGFALIGGSFYIKHEVVQGKVKIASAQSKVDQGNAIFSLTPQTKDVGKQLTAPIQGKIDEGRTEVEYYSDLAESLQMWGIGMLLVGGALVIFGKKRRTR